MEEIDEDELSNLLAKGEINTGICIHIEMINQAPIGIIKPELWSRISRTSTYFDLDLYVLSLEDEPYIRNPRSG
jgi:hypothetical protein